MLEAVVTEAKNDEALDGSRRIRLESTKSEERSSAELRAA